MKIKWTREKDGSYTSVAGKVWKDHPIWAYVPSKSQEYTRHASTLADAKQDCERYYASWERRNGPLPPMAEIVASFVAAWKALGNSPNRFGQIRVATAIVECLPRLAADPTGEVAKALEAWWRDG